MFENEYVFKDSQSSNTIIQDVSSFANGVILIPTEEELIRMYYACIARIALAGTMSVDDVFLHMEKETRNIKHLNEIELFKGKTPITSDRGHFVEFETPDGTQWLAVWSYKTLISISAYNSNFNGEYPVRITYLNRDMLRFSNTTSKLMRYLINGVCDTLTLSNIRDIAERDEALESIREAEFEDLA